VQTSESEEKRYADFRTYRAEKTYAVSTGKWYVCYPHSQSVPDFPLNGTNEAMSTCSVPTNMLLNAFTSCVVH